MPASRFDRPRPSAMNFGAVAMAIALTMATSDGQAAMPVYDGPNLVTDLCHAPRPQLPKVAFSENAQAQTRQFVVSLELTGPSTVKPVPAIVLDGGARGGGGEIRQQSLPVETVRVDGKVTTRTLEAKFFCTGYRYQVSALSLSDGRVDIDIHLQLAWFEGDANPSSYRTDIRDLRVTLPVGGTAVLKSQPELPAILQSVKVQLEEITR